MSKRHLSVFSLVMITVVSVDSIRNLPAAAMFGSHLIFFFLLGAIFFLIPCALVSAELAATWPEQGGIYQWVKHAFGQKVGFLAVWFQWIENVIWYPTILSFVAATVGYLVSPELADNKLFLIAVISACFWGATWINLRGMHHSSRFSDICAITGLLIPMVLIMALGALWVSQGKPQQITYDVQALLPDWQQSNMWVALTGIILSFCGIEIATVHAGDVPNPQSAFPRALFYSVCIILVTLMFGSLSIAVVLPTEKISLVAGIMQAFDAFFRAYHLTMMLPVIALMLILGSLGAVSNWIIAPTKGLLAAAKDGNLPVILQQTNKHGAPAPLLYLQASIVTLLAMIFLLLPSVNGSYWLLTVLAAQLYMSMYIMMFITAIALRLQHPEKRGSFQIPGGFAGLLTVCLMGLGGCIATILVGFIPPENIQIGGVWRYETLLVASLIVMSLPPFLTHRVKRRFTHTPLRYAEET